MASLSLISSILDSHEVVRRQLIYFQRWLPRSCEVILIDDGSHPSLRDVCNSVPTSFPLTWSPTRDTRPWTQPRGRNLGARLASSESLLFFDVDHILTEQLVADALSFHGDKFHWNRRPAVLDESGLVRTNENILIEHGWDGKPCGVSTNMFFVRRELFEILDGYDERFCGRYGGDDIDFNDRYVQLVESGAAKKAVVLGEGFVFPNPSADKKGLFHRLERVQ